MKLAALLTAGVAAWLAAQNPDGRTALPKAAEADLDNGLHVIVLEDRRRPQVAFQLVIPGAGGYDGKAELAAATAAALLHGTSTRSASQIATQLEEISSRLTIETEAASPDLIISGSCPSDEATKLLELATDVLLHPAFTKESEDVTAFYKTHYAPNHAVLAIDGDVSAFGARFYIGQKLGGWKRLDVAAPEVFDPAVAEQSAAAFEAPDSRWTGIAAYAGAVARSDQDYEPLQLMTAIVGGRLMASSDRGEWRITTTAPRESAEAALQVLLERIRRVREELVSEDLLALAKGSLTEPFRSSLESPEALAAYAAAQWRFKLPADYWDTYAQRINALTAEQVQAVARKYLAAIRTSAR